MKGLHVGGRAIIIKCIFPENLGLEVLLLKYDGKDDTWNVKSNRPVKCRTGFGSVSYLNSIWSRSSRLMPIDGEDFSREIESENSKCKVKVLK